jgi:hypothetical protein
MPGGRNLSISGFAPKVTTFRATLYAVLLGLSRRMGSSLKQYAQLEVRDCRLRLLEFSNFINMKGLSQGFSDCGLHNDNYAKFFQQKEFKFRA